MGMNEDVDTVYEARLGFGVNICIRRNIKILNFCLCRYLVKSYRQAKAGQQLSGIVSYLNEAKQHRVQPQPVAARPTVVDINDLASLVEVYKQRAAM